MGRCKHPFLSQVLLIHTKQLLFNEQGQLSFDVLEKSLSECFEYFFNARAINTEDFKNKLVKALLTNKEDQKFSRLVHLLLTCPIVSKHQIDQQWLDRKKAIDIIVEKAGKLAQKKHLYLVKARFYRSLLANTNKRFIFTESQKKMFLKELLVVTQNLKKIDTSVMVKQFYAVTVAFYGNST